MFSSGAVVETHMADVGRFWLDHLGLHTCDNKQNTIQT